MSENEKTLLNEDDLLPSNWRKEGLTLACINPNLRSIYTSLLAMFPTTFVNCSSHKRMYEWCGFRTSMCTIGAPNSSHRMGLALDLHEISVQKLATLRDFCTSSDGLKLGILRVEDVSATPSWVHIDLCKPNEQRWRDRTKPYIFLP